MGARLDGASGLTIMLTSSIEDSMPSLAVNPRIYVPVSVNVAAVFREWGSKNAVIPGPLTGSKLSSMCLLASRRRSLFLQGSQPEL